MKFDKIRRALLTLAIVVAGGCATPPDVAPFAQATIALEVSVQATERFAYAEAAEVDPQVAEDFKAEWEHRLKAMAAMSDYASSLVAIVGAADQGASAAREVLDSAEKLFATLGAAYPGASEVGQKVTSGVVAAFRAYAQDRAARTVAVALRHADPAVQEVADVLAADFATMHKSLVTLRRQELTDYITKSKTDSLLIGQVQGLEDELQALNQRLVSPLDTALVQQAETLAQLLERERALPAYAAYVAGLDALGQRYDAFEATTRTAADLVQAWGRSHRELIRAAEQRRAGSFETLASLSRELLDIYRQTRRTP